MNRHPGEARAPLVNIAGYRFTPIDDPDALVAKLRQKAEAESLRGTVLVAAEGINLFLAGVCGGMERFLSALLADSRFADIVIKRSHSRTQPFARLKVKHRREIISFRRSETSPLARRASVVAPLVLARWIRQGHDDGGRRVVLLDTRNREEVRHGTFTGAVTLPIDRFTDFPAAVAERRDTFADATVVSFCTGGIRCEKAALWMQANGIDNVLQLDGGILGYFEQVGACGYDGNCFVFDRRVALDCALRPIDAGGAGPA